jgi:hypothetical protein
VSLTDTGNAGVDDPAAADGITVGTWRSGAEHGAPKQRPADRDAFGACSLREKCEKLL